MTKELTIKKENIIYNLEASNMAEVIDSLSKLLYENNDIENIENFKEGVYRREQEIPTSIGKGVAIPHGKSAEVINSSVALATLTTHINWGEESTDKVKYVFLLAIKESAEPEKHLRILANLSTKLMDDDFVEKFKSAKNKEELFNVINYYSK